MDNEAMEAKIRELEKKVLLHNRVYVSISGISDKVTLSQSW